MRSLLVCPSNQYTMLGRFSAHHIHTFRLLEHEWNAANGCLRVLLDFSLGFFGAVPVAEEEAAFLDALLEFIVVVALVDVGIAIGDGFLLDVLLNVVEQVLDVLLNAFNRHIFFFQCVTAHHFHKSFLQVSGA